MEIAREGERYVLCMPERFDIREIRNFSQLMEEKLDELEGELVIDLSETGYIDSSGIGLLVSCVKETQERNINLILRNLNEDLLELFTETGVDVIFNIESSEGVNKAQIDIFEEGVDIRLEIKKEERKNNCVMCLKGVMNHPQGSRYFKQQFLLSMASYKSIILCLDELTFFDSLSVSVLLNMNKLVKETGGYMCICGVNYIILDLFNTLNIGQVIPIYENIEKAVAECGE